MHKDIGKMQTLTDAMDPARAAALHITLDRAGDPPAAGTPLPAFWHQIYFWDAQRPADLGRDGHPRTGGFIPDLGLPRRMWAGGRLAFHAPLLTGTPASKTTVIEDVQHKNGRTGPLAFVTLRHDIHQNGALCVTEHHDLVYRQDPAPQAPKPAAPLARTDETASETATFSSTLLFRYSALTFNGHRIHYDLDYCRDVEGYSGLVVHGPLLAQRLMALAEAQLGNLETFSFRATAPLLHFEAATFCWHDGALWVRGSDGRQCMAASAT